MKTLIYKLYFFYFKTFPIQRGKSFIGRCIYKCLGNAIFKFQNVKYELNPFSLIDRMLIDDGFYEKDIFEEINLNLEPDGGIFLDIGANFGLFTIQAAKLPNVNVFSFEPSQREIARLNRNVVLNDLTNVTIFPFGLSEKNYTAELNIHNNENQGMNSLLNMTSDGKKEKIKCYALDKILNQSLAEEIKVIKMDVEGFEYYVLQGMDDFLNTYNGPIILEVTYYLDIKSVENYDPDKIYDYLSSKGYKSKYGKKYNSQYNDFFYK